MVVPVRFTVNGGKDGWPEGGSMDESGAIIGMVTNESSFAG